MTLKNYSSTESDVSLRTRFVDENCVACESAGASSIFNKFNEVAINGTRVDKEGRM